MSRIFWSALTIHAFPFSRTLFFPKNVRHLRHPRGCDESFRERTPEIRLINQNVENPLEPMFLTRYQVALSPYATPLVLTVGRAPRPPSARRSDTLERHRFNSPSWRYLIQWRSQSGYRWKSDERQRDRDIGMKRLQSKRLRRACPWSDPWCRSKHRSAKRKCQTNG